MRSGLLLLFTLFSVVCNLTFIILYVSSIPKVVEFVNIVLIISNVSGS